MQKNLGYVIPSILIPDATNGIGYWYLGSVPLGVRATGTMWTIGADHYWYCDNTKTNYLAEIPVEDYNRQFQELLEGYADDWTTWLTDVQDQWSTFYNTEGAAFTLWFNRMKGQLSTDAAGNLQAQIDQLNYNFSDNVEPYTISSTNYAVGDYLMHNNRMYEVVKAIAQGDTFNDTISDPNHNIETRNIEDALDLSADMISYDNSSSVRTATDVQGVIDEIDAGLVTSTNVPFDFSYDATTQKYGYTVNNVFYPFKTAHTQTKIINTVGTTDMGEDHEYRYVETSGLMVTPTATKSITANGNNQDVLNYAKVNVNVPPSSACGPVVAIQDCVDRWHTSWITISDWSKYRGFAICAWAGNAVGGICYGTLTNGVAAYTWRSNENVYVEVSGNQIRAGEAIMSNVAPFLIVF